MTTAMRPQSMVSEAWRNLRSGTARALLLTTVFVLLVGGLAAADVRAVNDVAQGALEYRAAGASVQILAGASQIDGARCQALAGVEGVHGAGALRTAPGVRFLALPTTAVTAYEVTPHFIDTLVDDAGPARTGVWLSADLAVALGTTEGDLVTTDGGATRVAGVFRFPDDGRDRALSYAVLLPVPATGAFDACWVESWPMKAQVSGYLRLAQVVAPDADTQPVHQQLNARLGATYDAHGLFTERLTRSVPYLSVLVGLALGFAAVRARRLELAAALHARVAVGALAWQVLVEAAVWAASGVVICAPVLLFLAAQGAVDAVVPVWLIGLRSVGAAAVGAVLGAVVGALTTREKHLFRYFKDR